MAFDSILSIGIPVEAAELTKKAGGGGRKPTPRDLALDEFVKFVNQPENAEKAFPWDFSPDKLVTARAAAQRALKRTGLSDVVFMATKGNQIWFSQTKLTNRGRPRK